MTKYGWFFSDTVSLNNSHVSYCIINLLKLKKFVIKCIVKIKNTVQRQVLWLKWLMSCTQRFCFTVIVRINRLVCKKQTLNDKFILLSLVFLPFSSPWFSRIKSRKVAHFAFGPGGGSNKIEILELFIKQLLFYFPCLSRGGHHKHPLPT